MPYELSAFISIMIFVAVHLWARKTEELDRASHGIFLSASGGIAISYVFVDLFPNLCSNDVALKNALAGIFPYFEHHVYVLALIGFLLFFVVDSAHTSLLKRRAFWLSLGSYGLFNFFVGYAVADKNDPDIQPLALFTIAVGLHYFINDFSLSRNHGKAYENFGRWWLICCLVLGWFTGIMITIPVMAVALISAFIAGGVIMNVTRHELPKETPHNLGAFLGAAAVYTVILLAIGK